MEQTFITNAPTQHQIILENYASILEKTNQQLGLWSNPYGVMVGGLGVMVAFLAIVATAFTIWQNQKNKEIVQEELSKLFDKKQKSALELIENKGQEITEKLKTASGDEKKKLEEEKKQIKNIELEIKAGIPDFSQYMKKEDFLCKSCQNKRDGTYSILRPNWENNFSINNYFSVRRKCLSCGDEF